MQKRPYVIVLLALCLTIIGENKGAQTITGDQSSGSSFSFDILPRAYNVVDSLFFVGANSAPTGDGVNYSISVGGPLSTSFTKLTAGITATINGVAGQPNPLRGAVISALSLLGTNAVAVTSAEPSSIYIVQSFNENNYSLLKAANMLDGSGAPVTLVNALATNAPQFANLPIQKNLAVYEAVQIGRAGSSIAVAAVKEFNENDVTKISFNYLATTSLNTATSALYINHSLAAIAVDAVSLHAVNMFEEQMPWLYIGLQVQAGGAPGDGAFGVVAMPALQEAPNFFKIAPDTAITADSIIATNAANTQVNIYHVRTMFTTMQLPYLIVVGGVVGTSANNRTVYALPQLNANGGLAKISAEPQVTFSDQYPYRIINRAFVTPAAVAGDLYSSTAVPAQVGGGPAPGEVTDIFVSGDAVFVSVAVSSGSVQPGIFHSQALFDNFGRIKGWTNWQRVGATNVPVWRFAFDERSGNFWYLTGTSEATIQTVLRTQWEQGENGFSGLVNGLFSEKTGGVQGLFDIAKATTPALDGNISLNIMTGFQQVMIAQTGATTTGFGPVTDFSNGFRSTNGTTQGFTPGVTWLNFTGGVLDDLGAIIAATVVTDGTYGWFVVGGNGGVAVLAHADGTGWPVSLQNGFVGLDANMQWYKVGNYKNVRKLNPFFFNNQARFFVLTNAKFDRLVTSAATFSGGASPVTLAIPEGLPGGKNRWFADSLISGNLVLLSTSSALLRGANGIDIANSTTSSMNWVQVAIPESVGPVTRLYAISQDGVEANLATNVVPGNLYLLNAYVGYDQTRVYRFNVENSSTVSDSTLTQLPDYIVKNQKSFFINVGNYRNYMATDGSIFALSRSRYIDAPLFEELLGPTWKRPSLVVGQSQVMLRNALRVVTTKSHSIGRMLRSTGFGSWLVPGDFGLFVNE
jgi:hypothetical protein